jgi:ankyrin repeat protein
MNLPQNDSTNPIIKQFKLLNGQWELNDENIKRIDPETGETILHNYCQYINTTPLEVFKYLIEIKGCDVNTQDWNNNTPLRAAFGHFNNPNPGGDIALLVYLLDQKGVNVNAKGQFGRTLVHWACININTLPIDLFKVLIETLSGDLNALDKNNLTPIQHAFRQIRSNDGNIDILMYLLAQKDVNINNRGQLGRGLLHVACSNINTLPLDIFKYLVETLGCNVNLLDKYNDTPIHLALDSFNRNDGNLNVLNYLLQQGVKVNIKAHHGYTLLHQACLGINKLPLGIFKYLIETKGADVNAQNINNDTPLHLALRDFQPADNDDNITVLTYLLSQKDVNVNINGQYGCTALHEACDNIKNLPLDVFKLLIETKNANINAQDEFNNTPLHHAIRFLRQDDCFETAILIYLFGQNGLNINIKGEKARNLLHMVCIRSFLEDGDGDDDDDDGDDDDDDDLGFNQDDDDLEFDQDDMGCEESGENDAVWSLIAEVIVQRCVQQVFDGAGPA